MIQRHLYFNFNLTDSQSVIARDIGLTIEKYSSIRKIKYSSQIRRLQVIIIINLLVYEYTIINLLVYEYIRSTGKFCPFWLQQVSTRMRIFI